MEKKCPRYFPAYSHDKLTRQTKTDLAYLSALSCSYHLFPEDTPRGKAVIVIHTGSLQVCKMDS